jgi:hypothetical protein
MHSDKVVICSLSFIVCVVDEINGKRTFVFVHSLIMGCGKTPGAPCCENAEMRKRESEPALVSH